MRPFVRFGNLLKFSRPQNVIKFNASSLFFVVGSVNLTTVICLWALLCVWGCGLCHVCV